MDETHLINAARMLRTAYGIAKREVDELNAASRGAYLLRGEKVFRAVDNAKAVELHARAQKYLLGAGDPPGMDPDEPDPCTECALEHSEDGCMTDICPLNRGKVWEEIE